MDEVTANIDDQIVQKVGNTLRGLTDASRTFDLSDHGHIAEARRIIAKYDAWQNARMRAARLESELLYGAGGK